MASYYIGDLPTQERILAHQVQHLPIDHQRVAFQRLHKRVAKHFGLLNKYNADGSLKNIKKNKRGGK